MASDFFYPPTKNGIQKVLAAQLLNTATTTDPISFVDVDGLQNKAGVLVINAVDANGESTPANREYISYSGISGTTVLISTRNVDGSASAKTHAVGSIVDFIPDVVWAQRMIDQFLVEHTIAGAHNTAFVVTPTGTQTLTNKTLTSPLINGMMGTGGTLSLLRLDRPIAMGEVNLGNAGASIGVDWSRGDRQFLNINATLSIFHQNAIQGQVLTLRMVANATGGWPVTFSQSNSKFPTNSTGLVLGAANAINLAAIYFDGTNYLTQTAPGFT